MRIPGQDGAYLAAGNNRGRWTRGAGRGHDGTARETPRRLHAICERLRKWDIHLDPEAILPAAGDATPGRLHVARALVDAGARKSIGEAFDRFLKDGGPGDVGSQGGARLEVGDGVALGRAAGARVALAHPHSVGHPYVVAEMCRALAPAGLQGFEAVYGAYPQRVRMDWTRVADDSSALW